MSQATTVAASTWGPPLSCAIIFIHSCRSQHAPKQTMESKVACSQRQPLNLMCKFRFGHVSCSKLCACGSISAYSLHFVCFCRLYERRKKMEAKLAAVRAAAEHPVDPATGRPLFQPAIGRAPHYRRNQHGLPVGEYLYGMR
jgi:hypothetical protein